MPESKTICVKCFLPIEQNGFSHLWKSNSELIEHWEISRNEPWFSACPGSKENLVRWPTFGQWSEDPMPYNEKMKIRDAPSGNYYHEPMDALSMLVIEVANADV